MMVDMMKPNPTDVICDPACGTSGFLLTAGEYLKDNCHNEIFFDRKNKDHYMNKMFFGYDMDRTMLRIGAMNMMTHGIDNPFIEYRDSLSDQNPDKEKYSLILANPPFKGSLDNDTVSTDEIVIGDNDTLAAIVAQSVSADRLILLSDIDGLYTADPHKNPDAKLIHTVNVIDDALLSLAGASAGNQGTGGMVTKLQAAKICLDCNCEMIIANGSRPDNLYDIMDGMEIGTKFTGVMV